MSSSPIVGLRRKRLRIPPGVLDTPTAGVTVSFARKTTAAVRPILARSMRSNRADAAKKRRRKRRFCRSASAAPLMTPKSSFTLMEPLLSSSADLMRSKTSSSHLSTFPSCSNERSNFGP